jgi:hypothetical protein
MIFQSQLLYDVQLWSLWDNDEISQTHVELCEIADEHNMELSSQFFHLQQVIYGIWNRAVSSSVGEG